MGIDGKRLRFVEKAEVVNYELDGAGGDVGINQIWFALADFAGGINDEFVTEGFGESEGVFVLGSDDELDDAGVVAEVDKDETTMVATGIDPAFDSDLFA